MMICKADFEDLFPHLFKPEPTLPARKKAKTPSASCIARWEDDGGRSKPATRSSLVASGRRSQFGSDMRDFARAANSVATMPAAAVYAAAWIMCKRRRKSRPLFAFSVFGRAWRFTPWICI